MYVNLEKFIVKNIFMAIGSYESFLPYQLKIQYIIATEEGEIGTAM